MEAYEAIRSRRTVRDFDPRAIARSTLERILEAGVAAPSNDHLKSWDFVLVEGAAQRAELLGAIRKDASEAEIAGFLAGWAKDEAQRAMYFECVPKQHRMLLSAPALVIPAFAQAADLLRPDGLPGLNAFASMWCCIENILVAAAAEGIFGVTRIPFPEERARIRRVLGIPEGREVPCYLALGYPAAGATVHRVPDRPIASRIHENAW